MRRREQNRRRNRNLNPTAIWERFRFDIRAIRGALDGRDVTGYEHDNPDSENDEIEHEQEYADAATQAGRVEERISVEKFLLFVVNQHVAPSLAPSDRADDSMIEDNGTVQNMLMRRFLIVDRDLFFWEPKRSLNSYQYSENLKGVLYLNVPFQMQ